MTDHLLFLKDDILALEQQHSHEAIPLMRIAGQQAAQKIHSLFAHQYSHCVCLVGPGHNGGDALICAYELAQQGFTTTIVDPLTNTTYEKAATTECLQWLKTQLRYTHLPVLHKASIILDGLFGIGMKTPADDVFSRLLLAIHSVETHHVIVSLDLPSGLDANTGSLIDHHAVRAHHTITFMGLKPGMYTHCGPDHCGHIHLCPLILRNSKNSTGTLNLPHTFAHCLRPRHRNSHKGTYGTVLVIGGSRGMIGAAFLAARAAVHTGAGKVYAFIVSEPPPELDWLCPEILIRTKRHLLFEEQFLQQIDVIAIGPGLGLISYQATPLIKRVLETDKTVIIDADALNIISIDRTLQSYLRTRSAATVLTPHPQEAARLLATTIQVIQHDRLHSARRLAEQFRAYVVLKGCGSVIVTPNQQWCINPSGGPSLASGGSGDVLTGILASFIGQFSHATLEEAIKFGVYLHGYTSDSLLKNQQVTTPSTLITHLSQTWSTIYKAHHEPPAAS